MAGQPGQLVTGDAGNVRAVLASPSDPKLPEKVDRALVVDAMALYYTDRPDAFAIVSSDGDFTPLVMHLREKGAAVYGFGDHKTPEAFKSACSRFLVLDRLDVQEQEVEEAGEAAAGTPSGPAGTMDAPTELPSASLARTAVTS